MRSTSSRFLGRLRQRLSDFVPSLSAGILFCLSQFPQGSEARPVRVATYNIENGVGAIGSDEYNAVQAILARMDADIVCFQELQTTSFAAWSNMAATLGYSYNAIGWDGGSMAGSLYMGYFSRFPIVSTYNVESPPGAKEMSRYPFRAVIDVPEAEHPLVIWNEHHKSGAASIDKFRRAIEAYRISQNVDAYLAAHPNDIEYMLVGDLNDDIRDNQTAQYTNQPSGAPGEYILGSDIVFPVLYSKFPTDRYADAGLGFEHLPAYWEATTTPITRVASGRELDYVFLSPALAHSPLGAPQSELYYSAMDLGDGLPKWGEPLPAETSVAASDHLPTFVDIQMADYSPVLPTSTFEITGDVTGPFSPVSMFYTVAETNQLTCIWSVSADADWLTVVPDSFSLAPNASREVEVFLNSLAESMAPGVYTASVTFWNETTDEVRIRPVTLTIHDTLAVTPAEGLSSSGYAGGPFSPTSKVYAVTNKSSQPVTFTASANASWLSVSPSSWLLQAGGSVQVTVALNAQANSQPIGTHFATVAFSNQTSGFVQGRPIVLRAAGTLCDAVDSCNLTWTTGGNASWSYQTDVTLDGTDAAQSGSIAASQQSWMETVISGPGQVTYSWRVSSQTNTHLLRFMDNGLARDQISGETDWARQTIEIVSGVHTLRWAFATASTTPQGTNAGWVDQISIDRFAVSPADDWVVSGWAGGPFTPTSRIYTVTNAGSVAIPWSVAGSPNWITANSASGTLAPHSGTNVTCALNANAYALSSGTYSSSLVFSNQTSGLTLQRPVLLSATGPLCDAVDRCNLTWTTGGTSNWFSQTAVNHDGFDAAQSGRISTNQQTWMETTVTGPVQVSFWWRVSSRYQHYLSFKIDSQVQDQISYNINWTQKTYAVGSGTHTLRWTFTNTTTSAAGDNAGWVDQIALDYLMASPQDTWYLQGYPGGPFDPNTREYVLTNSGPTAIQWTATGTNWLAFTPDSGRLDPGAIAIVECSLSPQATAVPPGNYSTSMIFSNQTTGNAFGRTVSLQVKDYLVIDHAYSATSMGYVGGPYSPPEQGFVISNRGPDTANWVASSSGVSTNNWMTLSSAGGNLSAGATTNIVVGLNTNADRLPAGQTGGIVQFSNTNTHVQQAFWWHLKLEDAMTFSLDHQMLSGPVGGSFSSTAFSITNRSRVAQNWIAAVSTNWLTLDTTGGTLGGTSSMPIVAAVNSNATSLTGGVYSASVVISNLTGRTSASFTVYLYVGSIFCEAMEGCNLNWTCGGNTPWLYQTNVTHDGIDAATCGSIANGQESWMMVSMTGPGTLTYWWHVNGVYGRDFLDISVDGSYPLTGSATVPWRQMTNTFGAGTHTIRWRFYKNSSGTNILSGGAYVDQISWTPANTAMGVPVEWYQRFSLAPGSGDTWDDLDLLPSAAGAPNWVQYVTGLNPTNPVDLFEILTVQQAAGQPTRIEWWGGTNGPANPYVIQSTTNLEFGPWNSTGSIPRVEGLNTWTNAEPTDIKRYYRILALPDR